MKKLQENIEKLTHDVDIISSEKNKLGEKVEEEKK